MEEEISLRELLEIIWKWRRTIAIITIASVLIAGLLSFFVIKPTYEATTTISVSDITPQTGFFGSNTTVVLPNQNSNDGSMIQSDTADKDLSYLLSSILKYQDMTVNTYKEEVTNPQVLLDTIKQLKLDPKRYTLDNFKNEIDVQTIDNTNLITITVKEKDPKLAAKIADAIAANFKSYIVSRNNRQTDKLIATIESLINLQNSKIETATNALNSTNPANKAEYEQNQTKLNLLKSTRDIMMEKYNMLQLVKASNLGEQGIMVTSKAIVPDKPVSPKKSLNIAIAFILGLMVSVFVVFFAEYWKSTSVKVENK
ncbi:MULTISPECIES: YveK family protein [Thermoanaerobacterium]|uniref:Lipopolysaccharide biosynthesis protein n=2 Tax=Thermoanaerobacterium TaxID=28895 RepID=W9EAN7_9THEO|nr:MULTISPECIES: Wzz/FepE/Etk N-terminal domain-containing protein [Thermoanaerobacterium]AFK86484.1 lipopolysaccharide biosynthesis protein [Thermoanaerobacterium saccharolyticum JW/SL-YS485]ETO38231.1 lipopolysaccharide biosynthesis protein [Thermoanaerobacterium aotearoense SCUT27]